MSRCSNGTWPVAAAMTILASGCAHASDVAGVVPGPHDEAAMPMTLQQARAVDGQEVERAGERSQPAEEAEIREGRETAAYLSQTIGLVDDPELQWYVQQVGAAVARHSGRPDLPWYFAILDDPTPNALALPGGTIFVTRGMLAHLDSEAELAALLGHEIAHVAARHSIRVLGQLASARLEPPTPLVGNVPVESGIGALSREYGRQAERQADMLGFDYALAAGYDVREMDDVFLLLQRRERQIHPVRVPEFLATHPAAEERVARVRARLDSTTLPDGLRLGRTEYLERIDGLVYGTNPRTGFIHGAAFYHVEHRYAVKLPVGWTARNMGRVVVATAPDRSGVIYIGTVKSSAEDAARRLLELPGVDGRRVRSDPIGGVPARVITFNVETADGMRQGMAAFLEYDGRTHEILGIAAGTGFGSHGADIVGAVTSFQPLRDAALDDVQPLRVRIERVPEPMSVRAFADRYPSDVAIDDLVILNQAAHADAPLERGRLVKRIAGGR